MNMKKTLYILSVVLLGLVSCTKTDIDAPKEQKADETGLVAVTMKVQIPQAQLYAQTKALGDRSDTPSIKDIRVAVFGTSGYPQAYALAEPVDADGNPLSGYATTNYNEDTPATYYFKVLLPVYDGEAHVHIIANGDESIKFVDEDEESIMSAMKTTDNVGAYWARVVLPDGILTQLDQNGIMQTDDEGNFIPSTGTAALFEDLVLVRNFAEVRLLNNATNIRNVTWTLVNVPTMGSVAPMAAGTWVDDYKDYTFDTATGTMVNGSKTYDGFMFEDEPMNYDPPTDGDITTALSDPGFVFERVHPGSDKATCILMKAQFYNGTSWDEDHTYYRLDLTDEKVGGYFPIYRNYKYQVRINKVGNRGAKSIAEAMNRDSGGNVSLSTEAKKLTDISDGESRLEVEYVEKNFTSGGKKGLWVQYKPDILTGTVDNSSVTVTVKTSGDALVEGTPTTLTPTASSSVTGYYFYEFELNDQSETADRVSVLQVSANNGKTGDDKSTLYRDITLRVMKKMDMTLALVPKKVEGQGSSTVLKITLPEGLPESMFPLEFQIEDINHALAPTGEDGNGNSITVPVKVAKSLADGTTNSYYFIRTVASYQEYTTSNVISTEFETNKDASATTIYVANEYFKTQTINLLHDGVYVNPVNATVAFNVTSMEVEVEFADEETVKTWTVTPDSGVTITDLDGNALSGTQTGTGKFRMNFAANNSTTASATRTATVTSNGVDHTVTINQSPLEFSITPATQTVNFNTTTATVTVNAEEGKAWTASVNNGASLSATSGTGTATLTVTMPANATTSARQYTVTASMTNPAATATATITQLRTLTSPATFATSAFSMNANNYTGSVTSGDTYVTVALANATRSGNGNNQYIQLGRRQNNQTYQGGITITPVTGLKVTRITVTYSSDTYAGYDNTGRTVSSGTYTISGSTGTWTGSSSGAITITNGSTSWYGNYYFPRITSIVVTYEAAN